MPTPELARYGSAMASTFVRKQVHPGFYEGIGDCPRVERPGGGADAVPRVSRPGVSPIRFTYGDALGKSVVPQVLIVYAARGPGSSCRAKLTASRWEAPCPRRGPHEFSPACNAGNTNTPAYCSHGRTTEVSYVNRIGTVTVREALQRGQSSTEHQRQRGHSACSERVFA
jgi:hypothetical protein